MNGKKQRSVLIWIAAVIFLLAGSMGVQRAYAENTYGDDAYYYMEYLQTNYPQRAVAYPNLDAAAVWLKQEIAAMGYQYAGQPFSIPSGENIINGENIIFSKTGQSERVIVVGAHYDSVLTNGTDDNATGVGLLLETARRLATNGNLPYTVRFVLFSAEEPGCFGSQYYVDNLGTADREQILCMINLDTLGAGDTMYLYGGGLSENGYPVRTWVVEQALNAASVLGLPMSFHPDVNEQYPVPVKHTASDQQAFDRAGIPYLYFEASNWNGGDHNNFYQTSNPAVENGKMMHVAAYENLAFYNQTFGSRMYSHLKAYSTLLDYLLNHLAAYSAYIPYEYEECDETVYAVSDVRIRMQSSITADILYVLPEGEPVRRIGYNDEWSKVVYDSQEGYIKTEFLTEGEAETVEEPSEIDSTEAESVEEETEDETPSAEVETSSQEPDVSEEESNASVTEDAQESEETTEQESVLLPLETVKQNELLHNRPLERIVEELKNDEMLRMLVIIGIVAVAAFICIIVFAIQHRKGRR